MMAQQWQQPNHDQQQGQEPAKSGGVIAAIWNALNRDGTLAAAFRAGADEIAAAMRAFPESIHADVPGTILHPTQGEIGASREISIGRDPRLPSPSEIARGKQPYRPEQGHDHGQEHGNER
jgi:hypothetical protein